MAFEYYELLVLHSNVQLKYLFRLMCILNNEHVQYIYVNLIQMHVTIMRATEQDLTK